MLRTALQSIADQDILSEIDHVFVSEGKGDPSSKAVCKEFPNLPIHYIFRQKLPLLPHFQALMRECLQSPYTAILHDDDWWMPDHLSHGLRALESHPEATSYGSCYSVVWGESSLISSDSNAILWFGGNFPKYRPLWEFTTEEVLMGIILGTPAHYSTMILPTEALRKAAYVYDMDNSFDNDRMLTYALSRLGSTLYRPYPDACIRWHRNQDNVGLTPETKYRFMRSTTEWAGKLSGLGWNEIATRFITRLALCPTAEKKTIFPMATSPWCLIKLAELIDTTTLPEDILAMYRPIMPENRTGVANTILS
jgi:hypothetical protein